MPEQEKYLAAYQYGGTIRLGAWPCRVKRGSILGKLYGQDVVSERHRHRYEVNNKFFVGTQFHPEYKSRPLSPHPIFVAFIEAVGKLT